MLDKNLVKKLKKDYQLQEKERRQIIRQSNEILFQSKKAIFALHRNNNEEADSKIIELTKSLRKMEKDFSPKRLQTEGAFQAAAEEYVEAVCFQAIVKEQRIKKIKDLNLNHYSYVGGICDLIGEMLRYSTNQVSQGNFKIVNKLKNQAQDIMAELANFDFTGYLRTKYDQGSGHLRKLEQMSYDIKLKEKE